MADQRLFLSAGQRGIIRNINGDETCSLEEASIVCPFTKRSIMRTRVWG